MAVRMRFISTKVHGLLDYLVGGVLVGTSPWLFGYAKGGAETWVPVFMGIGAVLYSLMTDYELGVLRTLSMRGHLMIDWVWGVLLGASPWLFGFAGRVWVLHLAFGLFALAASLFTQRTPEHRQVPHRAAARHA